MTLHRKDGTGFTSRATAAGCIAALLFAVVLSVIPRLHEEIHSVAGTVNHECAVTLLSAGNCQHTPTPIVSLAPPAPPASFVHVLAGFALIPARLEFSLLEHAPPRIS
jgi:hypothetical protein